MKQNVICDMNIWYYIADGTIDISKHENVQLISPGVNIIEFASTEKLLTNIDVVKRGLKAVHDFGQLIPSETFDYIIKNNVNVDFDADETFFYNWIKGFELLLDGNVDEFFKSDENRKIFNDNLVQINLPAQIFADDMSASIIEIRKKGILDHGTVSKFKNYINNESPDSYKVITSLIGDIIAERLNVNKQSLFDKIYWPNLELFYYSWNNFLKDRITKTGNKNNPGAKIKINDIYDMMNLAYVGENDLYWTEEKSWLKLINKDPRTKKYIYNTWSEHLQ